VSSPEIHREELLVAILRVTAELGGARTAFSAAVAERFGLAATDVECLQLLDTDGAMPVGRLGELTALTTGATTRMVDRLEQAGYVRRVPDATDRRRVVVEPVPERTPAIGRAFDPLGVAVRSSLAGASEADLAALHAHLAGVLAAVRGEAVRLRSELSSTDDTGSTAAPVASATRGRLVFIGGAPSVVISGDPGLGRELYRARFEGAVPSARVRDGVVTIRYSRAAWFEWRTRIANQWIEASAHWRRDMTEFALNTAVPWTVELRGGATAVKADLRQVHLEAFDLAGGASLIALSLPRPVGVVPIRVKGGVGDVSILRPGGAAVRLGVKGGAREAILDGVATWSNARVETPGADLMADRYEIEIAGGANRVTVSVG
jgi:DNA-binding MarR family transcriptional regulator